MRNAGFPGAVGIEIRGAWFPNCVRTLATTMTMVPASRAAQAGNWARMSGTAEGSRAGTGFHLVGLVERRVKCQSPS